MFICQFGGDFISCYHPILVHYLGEVNGKPQYKYTGVQAAHLKKHEINYYPNDILVPCGKCIGCRLDYSKRWADRLMIELDHSKTAIFVTLTYDDKHLTSADPVEICGEHFQFHTLVKKELQDFNKLLRYHYRHKQIRFYSVGEYGSETLRPHFHGIYFGLELSDVCDLEKDFYKYNEHFQPLYKSPKLDSIWKNGFVTVANVSWQSCAYVARYNLKKLAQGKDNFAKQRGCIPEFSLMSRRPGIAGYFPYDHPDFFQNPRDSIVLSDLHGVKRVDNVKLPNYLFNKMNDTDSEESEILSKLGVVNPELYSIIKEQKRQAANERFLKELSNTDLDEFEYLAVKERAHEKLSDCLSRLL